MVLPSGIGPGSPPNAPLEIMIVLCPVLTVHDMAMVGPYVAWHVLKLVGTVKMSGYSILKLGSADILFFVT